MIKKFLILTSIFLTTILQSLAFEDFLIMSDSKLVDIKIENNKIIDVCPLITVMNDKNILIVHPLSVGTTCFTVLKNYKEKVMFSVNVTENKTYISNIEGFNILSLDEPPEFNYPNLDLPPVLKTRGEK